MGSFFVHMVKKTLRGEAAEPRPVLLLSSAFQPSFGVFFGEGFPINAGRRSRGRTAK